MPIITKREDVLKIYREAGERGWVIPCFCTENLTTTEAVIEAAQEFAEKNNLDHVPVTLAMTVKYEHRPQACHYTHSRNSETGLRLFVADAEVLMRKGGDYEKVDLLLHLDHVQHDLDEDLCMRDLSRFSTIMFDASTLPLDENIKKTRDFVKKKGNEIMIEGACDEIIDAGGQTHNEISTPEKCKEYVEKTGVDMVVANLGTEHRAAGKDLKYHGEAAGKIKEAIGSRIVLHGTSSVSNEQIKRLFDDGICKVNIWTALERDSTPVMMEELIENLSKTVGPEMVENLADRGYITQKCVTGEREALSQCTTVARQDIIFHEMKRMITGYLEMWYVFK